MTLWSIAESNLLVKMTIAAIDLRGQHLLIQNLINLHKNEGKTTH